MKDADPRTKQDLASTDSRQWGLMPVSLRWIVALNGEVLHRCIHGSARRIRGCWKQVMADTAAVITSSSIAASATKPVVRVSRQLGSTGDPPKAQAYQRDAVVRRRQTQA